MHGTIRCRQKEREMTNIAERLEHEMPRLRRYARALTRDVVAADDLVQDCLTRALSKAHLWQQGTDLRAWLFTILHNQHVNHVRRSVREGTAVALSDGEPALRTPPDQARGLELRDLDRCLRRLPAEQRAALLLIGRDGMRYEEVAAALAVPVGTIRSRLSRGRESLRQLLGLDAPPDRFRGAAAPCPAGRHGAGIARGNPEPAQPRQH
jgi:RNA polymerase sigma-70 factor, ECF subfamily